MTREQALTEARAAADRAKEMADRAESFARNYSHEYVETFAAAGGLWADVSRAYAAIAAAQTDTRTEV
ncbi:hypothetical protein [Streptomyces griseosporeus]|uniref:hypothetical protein n=1 Tax=Streptomyces griseosporeus TaxID=1910 RepID=UPI003701048D